MYFSYLKASIIFIILAFAIVRSLFVLYEKSNDLGSHHFKVIVALMGLSDVESPRYPGIGLQFPNVTDA